MCGGDRTVAGRGAPGLRLVTDERVDAATVRAAVGVPARGVAERQHVEGVEADDGVDAVVIAPQSVHELRALHLLGRLAKEAQRAGDLRRLHRLLRREARNE